MLRLIAAVLLVFASLTASAVPCEVGVDPRALERPPSVDPYGYGPLAIVTTGSNAPEMLFHVYGSSPVKGDVQRISTYQGPCRNEAFGRVVLHIWTTEVIRAGQLFFVVSRNRVTPNGLAPIGLGWALRRATAREERKYQTCHWS